MKLLVGSLLLAAIGATPAHAAATLTTLANFNGTNGQGPAAGLTADAAGNLLGTTRFGGAGSAGTVFQIPKTAGGYGTLSTIAALNSYNMNGGYPSAGLTADASGNLFGTTGGGGALGYGTVFVIPKTAGGYGTLSMFATFDNTNGNSPYAGLIADASGNLFGTTRYGGSLGYGTVFEIPKTAGGYGTLSTIASFALTNGSGPYAGLTVDAAGNLFGTTQSGGASGYGTVFEIPKTAGGYGTLSTIVDFTFTNGASPSSGLTVDAAGNLFGTTQSGGATGNGTVFEIPKTAGGYGLLSTIATFNDTNGSGPYAGLTADAAGNLFGTTLYGGASGNGTVFEIPKTAGGYGPLSTLVDFNNTNGALPFGGLTADASGNLFGTTYLGGTNAQGTVFEITGSGFVTDAPEPASLAVLGAGVAALGFVRRRRTPTPAPSFQG